jgi:hypothetical protein
LARFITLSEQNDRWREKYQLRNYNPIFDPNGPSVKKQGEK